MKRLLSACALLSLLAGCASTDIVDPHGYDKTGVASYYGAKHHGKRTASGERFNQHGLTAAHRQLPFGTRVKITNLNNDRSCVCLLYTSPSPRDLSTSRMPSSA